MEVTFSKDWAEFTAQFSQLPRKKQVALRNCAISCLRADGKEEDKHSVFAEIHRGWWNNHKSFDLLPDITLAEKLVELAIGV